MRFLRRLCLAITWLGTSQASQIQSLLGMGMGGNGTATAATASLNPTRLAKDIELQIASVDTGDYTIVQHSGFPYHQVRIKKTDFCDPTVNVYTGYLDVNQGAKHLFFYFFESRKSPKTDDVMMWINGGPGCSSSMGLLMELGPCNIDTTNVSPNGTVWNPYSWNNEANVFFLDQPVGVGFSYADYGETVETTEEASENVHAFLSIFFETFSEFSGRPLHLAGESYGGKYLPVFASTVWDKNQIAIKAGKPTLNLQSVIIGNGITDISTLYEGRYEIECGIAALDIPFQTIAHCVRMKTTLPRCQRQMQTHCIDHFDEIDCAGAVQFCESQLSSAMQESGRNVYDISKPCLGPLCYPATQVITNYLNSPPLRTLLSLPPASTLNFTSCSSTVGSAFASHLDKWRSPGSQFYVSSLLERGVRVLIYAGTLDWQCNWVANQRWLEKLEWSGGREFHEGQMKVWKVGEGEGGAGETKKSGPLTFATIWGAGHMVPYDKPMEALYMISKWLHKEDL